MKKIFTILLSICLLFSACAKIEDMSIKDAN